ncbi:MAG: PASTA domain-containing protein [Candidatus Schekmanbacteria bacterium]|nr:PASTA domain-containing protein [Candidatus Schekmanbacteria bacterium]
MSRLQAATAFVARFLVLVLAVGTAMIVVGATAYLVLLHRAETQVPDVSGLTLPQAFRELQRFDLYPELAAEEWNDAQPPGTIMRQEPAPGGRARVRSEVKLVISKGAGKVTIPDLVGSSRRQAELVLQQLKLGLGRVSRVPRRGATIDAVLAQQPAAGTAVGPGQTVDVAIAAPAPELLYVAPDLRGMDLRQAYALIERAGLAVEQVFEVSAPLPAGTVTDQEPAAGFLIHAGAAMTLHVVAGAAGPAPAPEDSEAAEPAPRFAGDSDFVFAVPDLFAGETLEILAIGKQEKATVLFSGAVTPGQRLEVSYIRADVDHLEVRSGAELLYREDLPEE